MSEVCCEVVWDGAWRSHHCEKPAKFEVDGKWYCGIHNPNKAPTKTHITAEENFKAKLNRNRLHAASDDLLAACVEFVRKVECGEAKSNKSYHQMKAAIAKATGEAND